MLKSRKNLVHLLVTGLFLFGSVNLFTSCSDDADTTRPGINLIEPTDGEVILIGSSIHFACEFSDDVELRSYKIDIHDAFDDHSHTKSASVGTSGEVPFSFSQSWTFEPGKKEAHIHHHEIVIPETINGHPVAEGHYHMGIYCTDAAGNESHVFIEIELSHDGEEHHHD